MREIKRKCISMRKFPQSTQKQKKEVGTSEVRVKQSPMPIQAISTSVWAGYFRYPFNLFLRIRVHPRIGYDVWLHSMESATSVHSEVPTYNMQVWRERSIRGQYRTEERAPLHLLQTSSGRPMIGQRRQTRSILVPLDCVNNPKGNPWGLD
ncbi:uncharacterized protein BO87DRAFT_439399 [Aspergillus neoniger CBS 115656]|uniref:Uncharacterized protein n=1 Tax=Aspergillus neoniger (strain CBS 115656) TaxID=1448310 RepID=A0A318YG96_ASPNB|nr:hypothetical protein BO87DRAFT_439399 [Aspergillus neoniger CBS 115656]PYH33134.1 hypothetical protein BO87DRAFT_439399 [Aspergillus neoniger CBS 115656]